MKRIPTIFLVTLVSLAAFAFAPATRAASVEFSANLVIAPSVGKPVKGRIFVKGEKVREETAGANGSQILIVRPDKKLTWLILPAGGRCLQMSYEPSDNVFEQLMAQTGKNAKYLGEEVVSGMQCRKYETTGNLGNTVFWVSERFSFPVRIENRDETIECTDIRQGELDDSLFKPPAGYKKTVTKIIPPEE